MIKKRVTYKMDIHCDIDQYGNVIPVGSSGAIVDTKTGKGLNSAKYPSDYKILIMWMGECFKYPRMKK